MKFKAGFTLVETLLVLAIAMGLLYFPVQRWQRWQAKLEGEYFFQQFERHLLNAQQQAVSNGKPTEVTVFRNRRLVTIKILETGHTNDKYEFEMPPSVSANRRTDIVFKGRTGNVSQIKNCTFTTTYSDEPVVFQFYLGSGRFERK